VSVACFQVGVSETS